MKLEVVLEEQEEGGYVVYVENLPGCFSQGETIEGALRNIAEAISLYFETEKQRKRVSWSLC
ncbi:type II toxin-antitoxin system HicB family antitoxin [Thermococcus sp. LS2]|nr:type II toxin-antitoxin system HicB family antitoxin [Thermococcus sp. LS2]